MNKRVFISALFLASTAASAQAYRCIENGKPIFSDRPCASIQVKKTEKQQEEKTAAQLQAEFEAEQADIKEGERLKAKTEADKKKKLEDAQRSCQAEKNKPAVVANSGWDGSVQQVKRFLDKTLRDPASFEAIEWGSVRRTCDGYFVLVKYRARNGFGGMVISTKAFTLDTNGLVVSAE